jgi:flagellar assembly protein FliH
MSTSHNPALREAKRGRQVEPYLYPESAVPLGQTGEREPGSGAEPERVQREAAARAAGQQEGEAAARAAFAAELGHIREQIVQAIAGFARERSNYYQQVETEVVQLALSIARKVLHREAHVDPLLLAGIVRVVLDKMESTTKVVVRVPPLQVAEFRSYFALHHQPEEAPEVIEDAALEANHCKLETALGTTELGLEVQLKEIENGLMDLLAQRPKSDT